jgi:hypothetical protein
VVVNATVWQQDPIVPILTYHQFMDDRGTSTPRHPSTALKINLSEFQAELQSLYDAGYSLVSLEDWLHGNMTAPAGRRPLILSMDDLFYNNQLLLTKTGDPDPRTGIGVLWQFYQAHPNFGFNLALFASLGDKLYASPDDPGWQDDLARAIAWCMDHDARVYNHFYDHPRLDHTTPENIAWDARMNDRYLRKLLGRIHREDLIALPYGLWPATLRGKKVLKNYQSPEGKPLEAIFEIDFIIRPKFLLPVYSSRFNRWHVPRIVANHDAIDYLAVNKEEFPTAASCALEIDSAQRAQQLDRRTLAVSWAVQTGKCPPGMYVVEGSLINARGTELPLRNDMINKVIPLP